MTGLYIREMINRGRLRRAIICAPAGLTWNWRRELRHFFDLDFTILRGSDFAKGDPASGLTRAIGEAGSRLAEHFPRRADDENELSDEISY